MISGLMAPSGALFAELEIVRESEAVQAELERIEPIAS